METNDNDMTAKHDVPKKKPPVVHTVETTTTKPKRQFHWIIKLYRNSLLFL